MKKLIMLFVIIAATLSFSTSVWAWGHGATGDGPPGWSKENPGKGGTGN